MRRHGEGSITRRKDGRWQVAVTMPNGRRRFAYLAASARRNEAEAKLGELLDARDERVADLRPDSPLGRFLRRWLADVALTLRPSTRRHYELIVRLHLEPALGRYRLSALTPAIVQEYLGEASLRLAPQTVRHHRAVLRRALNVAMRWGLVARNPAARAEPPRMPRVELSVLEPAGVRRLFEATADDRLHALYVVAATTGMREGELLGLAWPDVDLDEGRLAVARSLTRHEGRFVLVEPKSERSRRTIALSAMAVAALRAHRARQGQERLAAGQGGAYEGLVFTTLRGWPIHARELLKAF
jgi:integrase